MTDQFYGKTVSGALIEEMLDLLISDIMVEVELKRIMNGSHSGRVDRNGEQVSLPLDQLLSNEGITFVVLLTLPLGEGKNLRRMTAAAKAKALIRRL